MRVNAAVTEGAKLFFQAGHELVDGFLLCGEHFQQHQPRENSVALGHVAGKTDATALLRAEQHIALEHFRADVFEADAGLDHFQAVVRAHLVHHGGGGERLDDPSPALAVHDEMMQQQANQLVRRKRISAAIHAANAVGVAIRDQTNIVRMLFEISGTERVIFRESARGYAAEQRIVRAVQRGHPASGARQKRSKQPAPTPKSASCAKRSFDFAISLKSTNFLIAA